MSAWPEILAELYRVLREDAHAYLFCDWRTQRLFEDAASEAGFRVRRPLIWDKGSPALGGTWRSQYEFILFLEKGHRPGNFKNRGNVLRAPRVARGYPTEKPVKILRSLISQSSLPRRAGARSVLRLGERGAGGAGAGAAGAAV